MNTHITKLSNIGLLVTYNTKLQAVDYIEDTEIIIHSSKIVEIGKKLDSDDNTIDCKGRLVTPGFVDPHTHPVFLNGREDEFAMRLAGASYKKIAEAGGGINSSIEGVRSSSEEELVIAVMKRMDRFLKLGTTMIEAKSGYGLDIESELKSLRVLDIVNRNHQISIIPTFLGAHSFPPEYVDDKDAYVDILCKEMIPEVAKQRIAKYCDVFCENGYFTVEQSRRILETANKHGLTPRLHADEFEDSGAAALAAEVGAVSADHLMAISDKGIAKMAAKKVTAILLPGTTFFLGLSNYAPAQKLKQAGVPIALATDFNPGSCHIQSMPFIISLACLYLGLTVEEALVSSTINSAKTINVDNNVGSIEVGKQADLIIWDLEKLIEIPYNVTDIPIWKVIKSGDVVN